MVNKPKGLVIVGASGLGREVLWLARECGDRKILGWLDDADALQRSSICDAPVLGKVRDWKRWADAEFVVAVGAPRTRREIVEGMRESAGLAPTFATLVHPSVRMSQYVSIGDGCVLAAGCILTSQVTVGSHCVLDRGVNVGHDCEVGAFCTVSPLVPVGGNVVLGEGVWVGAAASIRQGIRMGEGSMAGMGAVVVKDVPANVVVAGSPARVIKSLPRWTADQAKAMKA